MNSGKYEYLASSGQGSAPSSYTSQSEIISDYQGATAVNHSTSARSFVKGSDFDTLMKGAAPALWRDPGNLTLSQENMSWYWSSTYYYASLVNNNILGDDAPNGVYPFGASDSNNLNIGILIDLQNNYKISDLQAIVVYNRQADNANGDRIQGFRPQLLDRYMNIVYDGVPFTGRDAYHRLNGQAWSTVSSSLLTDSQNDFATKIINVSGSSASNRTTVYDDFYNPSLFMYDATGTTFNGISGDNTTSQSGAIDLSSQFDVAAAGLLGNSNRTIVATINPNPYNGVNNIMGYGGWSENKSFMIRISNNHGGANGSGFGDGSYCLGVAGYNNEAWTTTLKISPNVETTFAISLDGIGDGTNSIAHFFLKEPPSLSFPDIITFETGSAWNSSTEVLYYNKVLETHYVFSGTPPSTISFTGGWATAGHSYWISTYTGNSVRYDLKYGSTGQVGPGHALIFSIDHNDQLILDVNDATHGYYDPTSFQINGTLASNLDVINAGDIIDLVNIDGSNPVTFTVPSELDPRIGFGNASANFGTVNINAATPSATNGDVQQFAYDSSDETLIITEIAYYSQGNYNYRFFMKIALNGDNIAGSARVATEGNSPFVSGSELIAAYEIAPNVHASMTYNFIKGTSFDSEAAGVNTSNAQSTTYELYDNATGAKLTSNNYDITFEINSNNEITLNVNPPTGGSSPTKFIINGSGPEITSGIVNVGDNISLYNTNNSVIANMIVPNPSLNGNWRMETVVLTNGQYNTELGEGFMIGGYPSSSTSVRHAYNGTIGKVEVYNFATTTVSTIENIVLEPEPAEPEPEPYVWSNVINISSATSVNKNGVSHSMIGSDGNWNVYNLFQVNPSDSDFLNKEYEIIWNSSLPGSWAGDNTGAEFVDHHEGYILDCNGIISQDALLTAPTWWWYSTGQIESNTANWVSYSPGGISVNASREYRTSHSLILKFTSNNTYTLTTNIEGTRKSYSYTSAFNFSEKTSIDFNYKINTHPSVGTIGSHTVTVSEINNEEFFANSAYLSVDRSYFIDFAQMEDLSVENTKLYMNNNFSNLKPQFLLNRAIATQGSSSNYDGLFKDSDGYDDTRNGAGITIWGASEREGEFQFTSNLDGKCVINYGCAWNNESVKILLNGVVINSTTNIGPIEYEFDVLTNDVISIFESASVIHLYSISLQGSISPINYWSKDITTYNYNLFTNKQFSTNDQDSSDSHETNSNTNSIGNIHHIVGLNNDNARYEGLDYWALDSSDGTVVVAAMDNSYVRMVKIDINGNTISDPITDRYNSDLSAISSRADLIERWTNGTSQPSSGYYIFKKSSNFDSIVSKLNDNNIVYQHDFTGLEIGGDAPSIYYDITQSEYGGYDINSISGNMSRSIYIEGIQLFDSDKASALLVLGIQGAGLSFSIVQQSSSYSNAPNKICIFMWDNTTEYYGQNISIPYDGKYHSLLVSYNKDASTNNLRIVLDGFQEEIGTLNPSAVNTTPSLARVGAFINNDVSSYDMGKLKIGKITIYNEYFESRLPHYDEPTISFAPVYPNGSYSAGDYSCEVSSVHSGSTSSQPFEGWMAFDLKDEPSANIWATYPDVYSSGNYIGFNGVKKNLGNNTTGGTTQDGEYLILNMPYARRFIGIKMASQMSNAAVSSGNPPTNAPKDWTIYGRKTLNGNWIELFQKTDSVPMFNPNGSQYYMTTPSIDYYKSFAFVLVKNNGGNNEVNSAGVSDIRFMCLYSEPTSAINTNLPLVCNTSNDFITINPGTTRFYRANSVEMYVKLEEISGTEHGMLFSIGESGNMGLVLMARKDVNEDLFLILRDAGDQTDQIKYGIKASPKNSAGYTHIVVTVDDDGKDVKIYLNGVIVDTSQNDTDVFWFYDKTDPMTAVWTYSTITEFTVGSSLEYPDMNMSNNRIGSTISLFNIYNTILTPNDVSALYGHIK